MTDNLWARGEETPSLTAVLSPPIVGFPLGKEALGGMLAGATLSVKRVPLGAVRFFGPETRHRCEPRPALAGLGAAFSRRFAPAGAGAGPHTS